MNPTDQPVTASVPRRYDPYNPHPASAASTLSCPSCRSTQPVFDDPVLGARCARCGSPVPVLFAGEPPAPGGG